jgi:hypothetical protein
VNLPDAAAVWVCLSSVGITVLLAKKMVKLVDLSSPADLKHIPERKCIELMCRKCADSMSFSILIQEYEIGGVWVRQLINV